MDYYYILHRYSWPPEDEPYVFFVNTYICLYSDTMRLTFEQF